VFKMGGKIGQKSDEAKGKILPLEDLLVVDFTQAVAGSFLSVLLGDLGAEVIHVEGPKTGDLARVWPPVRRGFSYYFGISNRNKKSMTLNLKSDEGRKIFLRLAERADVVVENFVPGTVGRFGVGYDHVRQVNPRIIYCHVSGFGQDGPYRDRPAFDQLIQGEAGIISYTGTPEVPCKVNVPITDILAAIYGAYAVLSALMCREKTGKGMEIDVSIFDCAVTLMSNLMNMHLIEGFRDEELRMGSKYYLATPYEPYRAKDGKYVNIVVATEPHWRAFCKAVGLEHIVDDPEFANNQARVRNREKLRKIMEEKMLERSRDEWIKTVLDAGVPCGRVNSIAEVIEHPQTKHRKTLVDVRHQKLGKIKLYNNPIRFSLFSINIKGPPELGEHTDEILRRLGYKDEEVQELREKGVI
jgi:crotonobetainyl-CoA:carnitine CoA-transferase CaiB-like acyl-CoA transferase